MSHLLVRRAAAAAIAAGIVVFFLMPVVSAPTPGDRQTAPAPDLDSILRQLAAYCLRLENAAFDFVCLEEIKEIVYPALDLKGPRESLSDWGYWDLARWHSTDPAALKKMRTRNSYVYDYQCVRANRQIREIRTLLEENRRKTREPNARLKTAVVVYGNALLWPVGLFGERFQSHYEYRIVGDAVIDGRPVVIIDATPRPDVPETRSLYGKAWIDRETLDILKVEWSERHIGRYEIFTKRGERYKRTPRLSVRSEFQVQKNGIRFPTSLFVEEAYLNDRGRAAIRSLTTVVYKDFKFFTVEVDVR